MSTRLTVALCQMTSVDDVDANLMQIESLLERIPADAGVRVAFFPENCLYQRLIEGEAMRALQLGDEVFSVLADHARKRRMHLHLGALPLRVDGHLYNSSVHISDLGEVRASYQKMHLFDITLRNGPSVRESDVYRHGQTPSILEIDGWKLGQTICYDVRFAELYSVYARAQVDAILVPAAFLMRTGEAHWEILLRARAIEAQAYLLAAAQGGTHRSVRGGGVRETWGHSLALDPWGKVLANLATRGPDLALLTLEKAEIDAVREQIPMASHRRWPVHS